jgi:hypothetical protein
MRMDPLNFFPSIFISLLSINFSQFLLDLNIYPIVYNSYYFLNFFYPFERIHSLFLWSKRANYKPDIWQFSLLIYEPDRKLEVRILLEVMMIQKSKSKSKYGKNLKQLYKYFPSSPLSNACVIQLLYFEGNAPFFLGFNSNPMKSVIS